MGDELRAAGAEVTTQVTDVSNGEAVDALAATAVDALGAVHLVCNNAGVGGGGPIDQLTTADWEWVLGVNLWGVIHGMRVFLPLLLAQDEGHIVNTASMAGLVAGPFMGPYNASKFAVVAISETARAELTLAGSGVGISVLCPTWVRTRIHESARNRPETLRNEASAAGDEREATLAGLIAGFIESGISPDEVAQRVAEAVVGDEFYILTHDETAVAVAARMNAIVDGGGPPLMMPQ